MTSSSADWLPARPCWIKAGQGDGRAQDESRQDRRPAGIVAMEQHRLGEPDPGDEDRHHHEEDGIALMHQDLDGLHRSEEHRVHGDNDQHDADAEPPGHAGVPAGAERGVCGGDGPHNAGDEPPKHAALLGLRAGGWGRLDDHSSTILPGPPGRQPRAPGPAQCSPRTTEDERRESDAMRCQGTEGASLAGGSGATFFASGSSSSGSSSGRCTLLKSRKTPAIKRPAR